MAFRDLLKIALTGVVLLSLGTAASRSLQFGSSRLDSDGRALTLRTEFGGDRPTGARFFARVNVPGARRETPVELRGRQLELVIPDGRPWAGLEVSLTWIARFPGGRVIESDAERIVVPFDLIVSPMTDAEVERFFATTMVIDGNLTPWFHNGIADARGYTRTRKATTEETVKALRAIGLHAMSITYSNRPGEPGRAISRFADYLDARSHYRRVRTSYDLEAARRAGQFAVLIYSQKHFPFEGDPKRVDRMYDEGLRILQVAYGKSDAPNQSADEQLGGGTRDYEPGEPGRDLGLTSLGRAVIRRMVKLRMLIDVSHCNDRTVIETVKAARVPVLANHANARALLPRTKSRAFHRERNMGDAALRAVAGSGGVIAVTAIGTFLDTEDDGGDIADYVEHVDYLVDLVGIDHVGLSGDGYLNGWPAKSRFFPGPELCRADRWKRVIQRLSAIQKNGQPKYSAVALRKIVGGNLLRVYREVLAGHTAPVPKRVEPSSDGIGLRWEPARVKGVPKPEYDVSVQGIAAGRLVDVHEVRGVRKNAVTVSRAALLRDDGTAFPRYRWVVVARNDHGRATSEPAHFTLGSGR